MLITGIEIQVPEYITNGARVWGNTTTGEFGGRGLNKSRDGRIPCPSLVQFFL